jgi:uncharacterized protein YutE (UPF0331/DUF86 family)
LPLTDLGRRIAAQNAEVQAAVQTLQEASQKGLTRDSLLDIFIESPNETRLATMVSMARSGLDYEFFTILTNRIDAAEGEEKQKLADLRDRLLKMTQEIDKRMQEQLNASRGMLEELLQAEDIETATSEMLPQLDDFFAEALRSELEAAQEKGDQDRFAKLQRVVSVLQQASGPTAEIALAEELMGAEDEAQRTEMLQAHAEEITPEFLQVLSSLVSQLEQQQQPEMAQRLQEVYRSALRFSMKANMKK